MLTFCTRTVIDHTAKGKPSKNLYIEKHTVLPHIDNRYTSMDLYIAPENTLNVCTDMPRCICACIYTSHGWEKVIGIDNRRVCPVVIYSLTAME